jgi:hypothetical protein
LLPIHLDDAIKVYFDHEYGFAHHWFLRLLAFVAANEMVSLAHHLEAQFGH